MHSRLIKRSSSRASRRYAAAARPLRTRRTRSCQDPVAANDTHVKSTWAERCQVRAEAHGLFDGAPRTQSRFQSRTRPAPSWQLRLKAATRESNTFCEHTRFARRWQGSRMGARPQSTAPRRAQSTTMSRIHSPLASSSWLLSHWPHDERPALRASVPHRNRSGLKLLSPY